MADARGRASKNADKSSTSARPGRLRVMRPEVKEFLSSPRRSRPKKQQPQPPPPPPPPRKKKEKEMEKERNKKGKKKAAAMGGEKVERAQYNCAFQDEGSRDFAPPQLVWGKVRSHPWWPGQVFDAADASEVALQHRKAGAPLVAYFWDRTFAWSDRSTLLPFHANFARMSAQSTMSSFVSAIDSALQEVGRRVESGLSCSCFDSSIAINQEVQNSGIRQGAYGAVVDAVYMRDGFHGEAFLDYISALGKKPLAGADLLELAIAKAQLRAFNLSRGSGDLPEFVMFEGIEEFAGATTRTKRERMHKSSKDDVLSKGKKSRHAWSSSRREVEALPEVENEEAMDEDGRVTDDTLSKGKRSKRTKSSVKNKIDISKHSDGLEAVAVADSRTLASKTVDIILSESKSGCRLRSMSKKEDALEGLKKLGMDESDELTGKSKDTPLLKENNLRRGAGSARKKGKITEDGHGLGDDLKNMQSSRSAQDFTSRGRRSGYIGDTKNSISKRVPISEHGRKKKKLSELMAETGNRNSASGGRRKSRGKRSLHDSTERTGDDRDSEDTLKTRKRKKLNTLGDLSSQSERLTRNKSSKAAGSSMLQSPSAVKANSAAPQTKSCRAKHRQVNAVGKSPNPVKVNQGNSEAFNEASLSCGEMLWQLSVAACDLKQREKVAPTSVNFFTDFRKKSYLSCSDIDEETPEETTNTESTPPEQPIADHMQDDYWADILINVEAPLSSLKKKKDESKKRASKKAPQAKKLPNDSSVATENANERRSEDKQDTEKGEQVKDESKLFVANGSQPSAETKSGEEMENSILAGLVLHFNRPGAVPSRSDLIKIFSQYGPVNEAKAEIANSSNSAQVIFKRRMDAEAAFAGAGKISALGPALVSFRLMDFPAAVSGNEPWHGASKGE